MHRKTKDYPLTSLLPKNLKSYLGPLFAFLILFPISIRFESIQSRLESRFYLFLSRRRRTSPNLDPCSHGRRMAVPQLCWRACSPEGPVSLRSGEVHQAGDAWCRSLPWGQRLKQAVPVFQGSTGKIIECLAFHTVAVRLK